MRTTTKALRPAWCIGSAVIHIGLMLCALAGYCSAQDDLALATVDSIDNLDTRQSEPQSEPDAPQASGEEDLEQPPDTDLETGLPLQALLTPLHWGFLSLLSFTAYEGYNSNTEFQQIPLGSMVTSLSGLALYSRQFAGWGLGLQYHPFIWISSQQTVKSFAAASADLRTIRHINGQWRWTLAEHFRYSPTHSTEQTTGLVAGPGGFTFGNAFLSNGRNVLANGVSATLTDRYGENSSLTFHAQQAFVHLSSFLGAAEPSDNLPSEDAISFVSGVTWRNHYSSRSALSMEYVYRVQASTGTSSRDFQSHTVGVGWSHKLRPNLGIAVTAGPAWPISVHERTSLHGSLALSQEFHKGGAVLAFARSYSFSGVIGDRFNNRVDLAVHRQISSHLHCSASASYVEQQMSRGSATRGTLVSGETRYFLSRNWAIFAQARYLDIVGSERILAPEKSVIIGFRWAWVPDKP